MHYIKGYNIFPLINLLFFMRILLTKQFSSLRLIQPKNFFSTMNHNLKNLLIQPNEDGISKAAELIKNGKLVAFPTETVYGLGANALNEKAVLSIFSAKGRPLTDPLIVHVYPSDQAYPLIELSEVEEKVFRSLTSQFWPGPLTLIVKASDKIPLLVTAQTGFVGIRCPKHPIAKRLIQASGLPIAAPSANRFGHVSPTKAEHVLNDLSDKGVFVLNGEGSESCEFGIESTVVKIDGPNQCLNIFRQGAISKNQLENVPIMKELNWNVKIISRTVKMDHQKTEDIDQASTSSTLGQEAPGQAITHYAPDIPCFIVRSEPVDEPNIHFIPFPSPIQDHQKENLEKTSSDKIVFIDFAGKYQADSSLFCGYKDLSPSGSYLEAARNLFDILRWAESVPNAEMVLISNVDTENKESRKLTTDDQEIKHGLVDRIFRAASGNYAAFK